MRARLIACSLPAWRLMGELARRWRKEAPDWEVEETVKCSALPELSEPRPLQECVGAWFKEADALVFLCAAGIAVRSIAPWLGHKAQDPAVIVIDEGGSFCISLLSGHTGGANELACRLAGWLGAVPVITTATDRAQVFAVDLFAKANGLALTDWEGAKRLTARLLAGERVGLCSQLPLDGKLPSGLQLYDWKLWEEEGGGKGQGLREGQIHEIQEGRMHRIQEGRMQEIPEWGICISWKKLPSDPFPHTLYLIPPVLTAGIGCRKGISYEAVEAAFANCLEENGIRPEAVAAVASIDWKEEEEGLQAFCQKRDLPFHGYSAARLLRAEGSRSSSSFVKQITGADNVCERSALADTDGTLVCGKRIWRGVTVALAAGRKVLRF